MGSNNIKCFVCENQFDDQKTSLNKAVNMPVCENCKDTEAEKQKEDELLDSLAEGFVCGCI